MSNSGAGYGSYSYASRESKWKAFDRLPRSVRDALNAAVRDWAPYPIWLRWNRGDFKDAKALVKTIQAWDRAWVAKVEKARAKGRIIAVMASIALAGFLIAASTTVVLADFCEPPVCWRSCEPIAGGMRCGTHCRRRCWREAPRYQPPAYAPPIYDPPQVYARAAPDYAPAYARTDGPDPSPAVVAGAVGVLVIMIFAIVAAVTAANTGSHEFTEIEAATTTAKSLAADAEQRAKAIDRFIEDRAADARAAGKAAAETEWETKTKRTDQDWMKELTRE